MTSYNSSTAKLCIIKLDGFKLFSGTVYFVKNTNQPDSVNFLETCAEVFVREVCDFANVR